MRETDRGGAAEQTSGPSGWLPGSIGCKVVEGARVEGETAGGQTDRKGRKGRAFEMERQNGPQKEKGHGDMNVKRETINH